MNNILYYGNCQLFAIKTLLNLQSFQELNIECFSTLINEEEFLDVIKKQDIIITQPIHDNYRDLRHLSTEFIINNCKPNCKIILIDSSHFDFYYFDLTYTYFNQEILKKPTYYHYNGMIECFKNNQSVEYYLNNFVNNVDLKTNDELENLANKSILELERRYNENCVKYKNNKNIFILTTSEFIKNNYKEKLLFYSMNHPTKYVIQNLCEQIIVILNINNTIKYNIDILDNYKSILYKCIEKVVNFKLDDYKPSVNETTNDYDITQLYYKSYQEIGFI